MRAHLDTHVVMWLRNGEKRRLKPALRLLQTASLLVSPMVVFEIQLLRELGRYGESPETTLSALGIPQAVNDWREVVERAGELAWTRDPFDRLIVAHALVDGAVLITADMKILEHCLAARWD